MSLFIDVLTEVILNLELMLLLEFAAKIDFSGIQIFVKLSGYVLGLKRKSTDKYVYLLAHSVPVLPIN